MAKIILNKKDVLTLIGKKISDSDLQEKASMLGIPIETITEIDIIAEVFPNRPDLLSEEGFSRALSAFLQIKPGLREYKVNESNYKFKIDDKVKNVRPCVAQAVIKDIKITNEVLNSLMQLQEKLHITHGRNRKKVSLGLYDLDKIKFPLTYTTKPKNFKFIPLDFKHEMTLSEILEKHPKGIEFGNLIKDFKEAPIWLDSDNQVLSMPPIINSEQTKVTLKTKNLFIDATGIDQRAVDIALNILVAACADRNGKIYKVNENPRLAPNKVNLNLKKKEKITGLKFTNVKQLLEMMGLTIISNTILIPAYRQDIINQVDIAEELAIAYGYDNIKEEIPNISTIAQEDKFEIFKNKVANLLTGLNLIEVNTYHLINNDNQTKLMNINLDTIKILNPINLEYNSLRSWLIPSLLQVIKNNKHNHYPQNIFEISNIFNKENEFSNLAILICHEKANFTEIKQVLDVLFNSLSLNYDIIEIEHSSFIPGRVGSIIVNNNLGYIGELHPEVLVNYDLDLPISILELNLTALFFLIAKSL